VSTQPTGPTISRHADFCLPRPGEEAPRIEAYSAARYGPDGLTVVGSTQVVRCQECGFATYDGKLQES